MAEVVRFPKVTVEQASAHIFVSISRFRQLQRQGVLPRASSSDWTLDRIRQRYIENLRVARGNHLPKVLERAAGDDDQPDLNRELALLAREQRVGHELKNAAARGALIPAAEVTEAWQPAIARARSLLLGLPPAAAGELAILARQGPAAVRERLAELANTSVDELVAGGADGGGGAA